MKRWMSAVAVIVIALAITGCAQRDDSTYTSEAARTLQSAVLSVTEAAAADDPETALARLDDLETVLIDQLARGAIDQARFTSVSSAMKLVRIDLELLASQSDNSDTSGPGNSGNSGKPDKPGKPGKND